MQTLWSSGASNRTGSWMLHQSDIYIVRPVIHPTTRNEMVKNLACSLDHRLLAPQNVVTVVLMILNSGLRGHTYSSPWSCRWNIEDGKCNLVHHCQDTFWIAHKVIPRLPPCSPSSCRLRLSARVLDAAVADANLAAGYLLLDERTAPDRGAASLDGWRSTCFHSFFLFLFINYSSYLLLPPSPFIRHDGTWHGLLNNTLTIYLSYIISFFIINL